MTVPRAGSAAASPDAIDAAILVVDDNAAKRMAIRAMLTPLGHAVVEADSGRAALRAVVRQDFAVILMDVRMPSLDGYETAQLIRQRAESESTPIIFLTAYGRDEVETATAYESGAVDFIFAPILADVLRAKVSAFVDLFAKGQKLQSSLDSITELNAALRDSEVRARAVLQNVADGIVTAGEGGVIESFNQAARQLFGYREEDVIGQPLQILIAPDRQQDFAESARAGWSLLTAHEIPAEMYETVGCHKDGSCFPMEMNVSQMQIGERMFTIGCIRDISGRTAYMAALEERTLHDELTGLPNKALFADRMDRSLTSASRVDEARAVLLVDLDRFSVVNDKVGRAKADRVLAAAGARLRESVRDLDTVARLEGDSFGILPVGVTDVGTAAGIAWKLREAFDQPFAIGDEVIDVGATVGMAFFPEHGRTTEDLIRRAGLALRDAKRTGAAIAVFQADSEDVLGRRLTLLDELRQAIDHGDLILHYQPKIEVATGKTVGVEALVRWNHPTDGLRMPAQFLPDVEPSNLIDLLTGWVLDEALGQQRRWCDAGIDLTMAVNISARSLGVNSDLPVLVGQLTRKWDIAPGSLVLELTESAVLDTGAPAVLDVLHGMGECISVDDFGTGHASLVYLQRLPIDQIKIDRSFVQNMATQSSDAVIVKSTIDLAHNLGLKVVGEGVEDRACPRDAPRVRLRRRPGLPHQPAAARGRTHPVADATHSPGRRSCLQLAPC